MEFELLAMCCFFACSPYVAWVSFRLLQGIMKTVCLHDALQWTDVPFRANSPMLCPVLIEPTETFDHDKVVNLFYCYLHMYIMTISYKVKIWYQ